MVGLKLKVLIFNLHGQNQLEGDDLSGKVKRRALAYLALHPDSSPV